MQSNKYKHRFKQYGHSFFVPKNSLSRKKNVKKQEIVPKKFFDLFLFTQLFLEEFPVIYIYLPQSFLVTFYPRIKTKKILREKSLTFSICWSWKSERVSE